MTKVEHKLFSWHRLYTQLKDARLSLARADAHERANLEAQISRLQEESDSTLYELNTAAAEAKGSGAGDGRA